MLPEGWRETKVGKEYSVQLGKMLNKVAKEKYPQFKYLTNINIRWGGFSVDNLNSMYFTESERKKFNLSFGDLLVCEGGDVGRCAIWENNLEDCFYQKALHRVRSLHGNLTKYLGYILEYFSFIGKFKDIATRTSIAHLTKEKLENTSILLPPLPEQEKIAAILSTWDKAISTTDALLANSRQQKKALMQQLLTGKRRLPGFTGEWEEFQLLQRAIIIKGTQINKNTLASSGDYPVMNGGILPSGYFNLYNSPANSIIISEGGNSCGFVQYMKTCFWCGGHCYKLEIKYDFDRYIYHYLKFFENRIMALRVGSGLPNIQKERLASFAVKVPPLDEQRAIAAVLDAADKEIVLLEQKVARLREEKKALMQQLLTGKRRVRL